MQVIIRGIPWIISTVLLTVLFVALQSRSSWKIRALAEEDRSQYLIDRVIADASFLDGDHGTAMQRYQDLALKSGDSSVLEQRRAYLDEFMYMNSNDPATERARLEARLMRAEQLLARYQKMEGDLQKGSQQLKREEEQLKLAFGSLLDQHTNELQHASKEIASRTALAMLRFPSAKKGAEVIYLGHVTNGMANGSGSGVWLTGSVYEGSWQNNLRHGQGEFVWPDGERYVGEYVSDMRTGQGVYRWKNGQRWEGEWKEDKRHGEGVLYEASGKVRVRGIWENDKLVKTHKDAE